MAETTLHPEYYCIGPVLENGVGAGSLLAGIILEIADPAFRIKLVRVMGEFALYDGDGRLLLFLRRSFPYPFWRKFRLPYA